MISKDIYFMVELMDLLDGHSNQVLCKEKDLASFIANYDNDKYKVINVYGIGNVCLDGQEFIKRNDNLEHGGISNAS